MSLPETKLTMHRLRPHWGHVTAHESPVDEEQRESGLIVPLTGVNGEGLRRGVVLHVSDFDTWGRPYDSEDGHEMLAPGTVVYFRVSERVGDVLVIDRKDILALEVEE